MKRGISSIAVISAIVVIGGVLLWVSTRSSGLSGSGKTHAGELYSVNRGSFDISIPTSGELSAQNRVDIHNLVESDAVIVSLIDEGEHVKKGDLLFELNDEKLVDSIRQKEMEVIAAKNEVENGELGLSITEKKRDSELAAKQLAVDLANLALQAWQEGELVSKRQQLDLAVQTAEKNYQRLLKKYESSTSLYEQKFLSKDELDQDEIALLNADATLKKAKLDVEVYENYTYQQEKQKKESDLQQAKDELERAIQRLESEINQATENVKMSRYRLVKQEEHLAKRKSQLDKCVVTSPASGMVVYASSLGDRREEDEPLRVGRSLWRNQLVMMIPDSSNMNARVKVNEALSGLVSSGQRATIVCDAFPDVVFSGEVLSVGILATGGGWRDPNRRDYTVEISIDNPEQFSLKPSMRCSAEIFVESVEDALFVPIHSIHRNGDITWVWVKRSGGFSQQAVVPNRFSESYVELSSGVEEGDVVLLREPLPSQVVGRIDIGSSE